MTRRQVTEEEQRLREEELSNGREYTQTMWPWGGLPARTSVPSWCLRADGNLLQLISQGSRLAWKLPREPDVHSEECAHHSHQRRQELHTRAALQADPDAASAGATKHGVGVPQLPRWSERGTGPQTGTQQHGLYAPDPTLYHRRSHAHTCREGTLATAHPPRPYLSSQ